MAQLELKHIPQATPTIPEDWRPFRQQFDDIFDRFMGRFDPFVPKLQSALEHAWLENFRKGASLAVEVSDTNKAYVITAELPGMDEKDIEVSVSDGTLVIKGEKRQEHEEKDESRYFSERSYGTFQRAFTLPKGTDESKLEATFHNGLLTVKVPKASGASARKIEVKRA